MHENVIKKKIHKHFQMCFGHQQKNNKKKVQNIKETPTLIFKYIFSKKSKKIKDAFK